MTDQRIGVFVCHCGENIAGKVDVKRLVEMAKKMPGVVFATDYLFMCSKPGLDLMRDKVREMGLTATVVASCSHEQHWKTFADAIAEEGLNPNRHTQVNVREFVSWVTEDPDRATQKATRYLSAGVTRAAMAEDIENVRIPVTKRVMVIGGGVAGLRAAFDCAEMGVPVILVEKEATIGGHMAMLNKTFPTDECPMCTVSPLLTGVFSHPLIQVLTNSEVTGKEGTSGNFEIEVTTNARYVRESCTSCGRCAEVCPVEVPNEFDRGFGVRKAIYKPFPQALPSRYIVDRSHCIECGRCQLVCPADAVDLNMKKKTTQKFSVGSIIVAIGYDEYDPREITPYHSKHPNVITQLQLERLLAPTTLNRGKIMRPLDGKVPRSVVVVQCVGSRNEQVGNEYCTGVCCMFGIKNASIIKEHLPDSEVYLCYIDIRTPGLYYEEYYRRAQKMGVRFVRGRPAEILPQSDGSLRVVVEDTLRNQPMEINADLVVLSAGMVATPGVGRLGGILGLLRTKEGFARDFHIKMGPVRSSKDGIYLAGTVQGPKDITQTVAHAGGAASAAVQPVLKGYLERRLDTAFITPEKCINCLACIAVCRAGAIQVREEGSSPIIVDTACQSCGICVPVCPTSAIQLRNFTEEQILAETRELLSSASLGSDAQ